MTLRERIEAYDDYVGVPVDDPQEFDMDELAEKAAKGALNNVELAGATWSTFPTDLARYALDVLVGDLLVLGHRETPLGELARRLGIVDEEGNWT